MWYFFPSIEWNSFGSMLFQFQCIFSFYSKRFNEHLVAFEFRDCGRIPHKTWKILLQFMHIILINDSKTNKMLCSHIWFGHFHFISPNVHELGNMF